MANFVATFRKGDLSQTFVFEGSKTLDEVFDHVAQRARDPSLHEVMMGPSKIFSIVLSRDESSEPAEEGVLARRQRERST